MFITTAYVKLNNFITICANIFIQILTLQACGFLQIIEPTTFTACYNFITNFTVPISIDLFGYGDIVNRLFSIIKLVFPIKNILSSQ